MKDVFSCPQNLLLDTTGGFAQREDVYMILNQFCLEIKYPTTLLCLDEDKNIQRFDSARVGFLLDKSCDTFRRIGGYAYCLENDITHALPYLLNQKEVPLIGYEMYTCQYMGYSEYIFPIEIENNVIAVLFVGQIKKCDDEFIIKTKKDTLAKYKDVFQKNICNKNDFSITYEDVSNRIVSEDRDPFLQIGDESGYDLNKNIRTFMSQNEIDTFVNTQVLPNVLKLKEQLCDVLFEYRKKYIAALLTRFEDSYNNKHIAFLKNYDALEERGQVNITDYWNSFIDLYYELQHSLDIENITYYEQKKETDSSVYEIKISTDQSLNGEEVTLFLPSLDTKKYIIDERSHIKYVIQVEFSSSSILSKDLQLFFLNEFSKTMKSTLNICSYAIRSKVDSNNNLTTLRIYRHEMDQLIFTLDSINYKLSPNYKEVLDNPKIEKMHKDFTSSLETANYITKNIEYFTYSQRGLSNDYGPKEWINIFNKLNKWRLFVIEEAIKKNVNIIVPNEEERRARGENTSGFFCVEEGLESILYNIINNAIKYCHRGSNIYLDCKSLYVDNKLRQVIMITDYGYGIDTKRADDIFKLYYRAVDAHLNIDGSGIGLYLSKLIANDIDIDIQYNCQLISKFNIPLLEKYILNHFNLESAPLDDVRKEYDRIIGKEYDKIVSPFSKKISNIGVKNDICTPTYKVTFEVII